MYELLDINPKIQNNFWQVLAKALQKDSWEPLLLVALKKTFHKLFPEIPFYLLEHHMKKSLQVIHDRKNIIFTLGITPQGLNIEYSLFYSKNIKRVSFLNDI
jgi:hypothetical protein